MDASHIFMEGLVNPRAVAVTNDGILVGEPPNLWLCALPDPQAVCTAPVRVGDYAPELSESNVEYLENGLVAGLDNWLYNAKSARSFLLRDGVLEVRQGPHRGQWGIAHDNHGRLFYNHNSTWLQADLFAAEDLVVAGEERDLVGIGEKLTTPSEVFSVRVNPGVNRAYLEGTLRPDGRLHEATGVSGLAVYRGDQFPEGYLHDVFVPEVAANVVAHFRLQEIGMALTAEHQLYADPEWGQREFLGSTDERFRPVDAGNGPDGALYIIDMYRGIIQDAYYLSDELREQILQRHLDKPLGKGRIWRVRHVEGPVSRSAVNLASASNAVLVQTLRTGNGWQRDTAQRLLLVRDGELRAELAAVALGPDTVAAGHALWTLQGRGELDRDLVLQVIATGDAWRQVQALRAGGQLLDVTDMLALATELREAPERVQVQWALAQRQQQHAASPAIRRALRERLLANLESPYVRQAVVRAVRGEELAFLSEVLYAAAFEVPTEPAKQVLGALAASAYRTLRGDLTSTDPAPPALSSLLAVLAQPTGERTWQQAAMLQGLHGLTRQAGFEPAHLPEQPSVFADDSGIDNTLAEARLAGRRAFTWPGDPVAQGVQPLTPDQRLSMQRGAAFFPRCAACHGNEGGGITGLAPPLAGADWVTGPPEWLGRIILQGMTGPIVVNSVPFEGVMPAHGHIQELDDELLAGLMTYLRRSWGNTASAVSPAQVRSIRAASQSRSQPWTAVELREVPVDRGFGDFVGKYSVAFITITISERAEGLYMEATAGGGGPLVRQNDTWFVVGSKQSGVQVEFIRDADGAVSSLVIHREGQDIPAQRK
jgi:mono/diheme cytochrome c family protein